MNQANAPTTAERKQSHVEICLQENAGFSTKTTGFESYEFEHNAAPEINFKDIDLSTTFLGFRIGLPLMISSMTGGYGDALELNRLIAETAEKFSIPLGVGSMRQTLESSTHRESFAIVRKAAPSVPVFANIGAPEVAAGLSDDQLSMMLELIRADGLIVHLNPAQELFQPEGNTSFSNFLQQLERITGTISVPVMAKEVGCGISATTARRLADAGVKAIDVAGAGGLSWQKVEEIRYIREFGEENRFSDSGLEELLEWGIPTARCVADISQLKQLHSQYSNLDIIASGGIRNGIDIAKSIALGASIAASAQHLLKALRSGHLEETINTWMNDIRAVMFLTGSATIEQLQQSRITKKL
jgi:isopentenyl-diphosphate delta-isomerase